MNQTNKYETQADDRNSIIDIIGVNKSYRIGDMEVPILQNINLTVKSGEVLAIMGL